MKSESAPTTDPPLQSTPLERTASEPTAGPSALEELKSVPEKWLGSEVADAADPVTQAPPGMVYVPGGVATIGLTESEIQEMKLESILELNLLAGCTPQHKVRIEGFYLDSCEVTNGEWREYLKATKQSPSDDLINLAWPAGRIPEGEQDHPISGVSYREAESFARWAGKRLPTEVEWEYAARGADGFIYPWGDEFDRSKAHWSGSKMVGGRRSQKTGTLPAGKSPYGLLDMAGNVWEWTSSKYVAYEGYQDIEVATRFTRGKLAPFAAAGLFSNKKVVIRGGAWNTPQIALLSALRQPAEPKEWNIAIGFRCARDVHPARYLIEQRVSKLPKKTLKLLSLDWDALLSYRLPAEDVERGAWGDRRIIFAPTASTKLPVQMPRSGPQKRSFLGVLLTTVPLKNPDLPAGLYLAVLEQSSISHWALPTGSDSGWQPYPATTPGGVPYDPSLDHILLVDPDGAPVSRRAVEETPQGWAPSDAALAVERCIGEPVLKLSFNFPAGAGKTNRPPFCLPLWVEP